MKRQLRQVAKEERLKNPVPIIGGKRVYVPVGGCSVFLTHRMVIWFDWAPRSHLMLTRVCGYVGCSPAPGLCALHLQCLCLTNSHSHKANSVPARCVDSEKERSLQLGESNTCFACVPTGDDSTKSCARAVHTVQAAITVRDRTANKVRVPACTTAAVDPCSGVECAHAACVCACVWLRLFPVNARARPKLWVWVVCSLCVECAVEPWNASGRANTVHSICHSWTPPIWWWWCADEHQLGAPRTHRALPALLLNTTLTSDSATMPRQRTPHHTPTQATCPCCHLGPPR